MTPEVLLSSGYAGALAHFGLHARVAIGTHPPTFAAGYRTAGFEYRSEHDRWVCPEGQPLWPHRVRPREKAGPYRAKAQICNACPRKSALHRFGPRAGDRPPFGPVAALRGRPLPPRTGTADDLRLAALILVVEATRHHAAGELALLGGVLLLAALSARWLVRDLRRHPANFPAPSPSQGLGFANRRHPARPR